MNQGKDFEMHIFNTVSTKNENEILFSCIRAVAEILEADISKLR